MRLVATTADLIFISTDSGSIWTQVNLPGMWTSVASSADGLRLVVVAEGGYIYTSSNGGTTWSNANNAGRRGWYAVASSSDGSKLAAGADQDDIYTSSDSGLTWYKNNVGNLNWWAIASNANGTQLIAADYNGALYVGAPTPISLADEGSVSCFSGDSVVTSHDGTFKLMSQVRVGDLVRFFLRYIFSLYLRYLKTNSQILAANIDESMDYARVISVPHGYNEISTHFIELTTTSGRDIRVTGDHLIAAGSCYSEGPLPLTKALLVQVGECVKTVNGLEVISTVEQVVSSGLYTLITTKPLIVVNGFVASPFAVNHSLGDWFYTVLRKAFQIFPGLLKMTTFVATYESVSEWVRIISSHL